MTSTYLALVIIGGWLLWSSIIGLIPATLAKNKGRSFTRWWGISAALLGIFAVIPVAMLPTHRCPECREVVAPSATICWHCRASLPPTTAPAMGVDDEPITAGWVAVFIGLGFLLLGCDAVISATAFHVLPAGGALALTGGITIAFLIVAALVVPFVLRYRE